MKALAGIRELKPSRNEFRQIVEEHQARVFSIALRMLGDTGEAEEVAQDVFLELHRNLASITTEAHLLAWLRKVACHRATDALRRRSRRLEYAADELHEESVFLQPETRESPLAGRVEQLLLTLPEAQRMVMLLRYQEDLDPEEIAATLAMPVATVKSYLQRALKLLRTKADHSLREYTRNAI